MSLNKMSKEEIELLSYTDIAKLYLEENKTTLNTAELFKAVCELLSLSEIEYSDKITDFFQSLTTSKDFILLNDGKWDLKSKHSVKLSMDELYEEQADEEEYEGEPEDEIEEENSILYLKRYLKENLLVVSGDGKLDLNFLSVGDVRIIPLGSEVLGYLPDNSFLYKSVPNGLKGTIDLLNIVDDLIN